MIIIVRGAFIATQDIRERRGSGTGVCSNVSDTCAQCPTSSCTGGQAPVALVDLLDVFCNKQDLIE